MAIQKSPERGKLQEAITVDEWQRNGRGQTNRVSFRTYGGHQLFDVRIWWVGDDGTTLHPGKGFSCRVKDLPRLAAAITKSLEQARALGLPVDEGSE